MRRTIVTAAATLVLALATQAQTLSVVAGSVIYQFPSATTGDMTYTDDGSSLTIQNRTFAVGDITSMYVDANEVADNQVVVAYEASLRQGTHSTKNRHDVCCFFCATVTGSATSAQLGPGASMSIHIACSAPVSLRTSSM